MTRQELMISERKRALKLFSAKHKSGFENKADFAEWFMKQLIAQDLSCFYCETSILEIRQLIKLGLLGTRKTGHGLRGPVLEIDKRANHQGYMPANCVLACYYCNNDKSYTLDAEAYKQFFGPNRNAFYKHLFSIT